MGPSISNWDTNPNCRKQFQGSSQLPALINLSSTWMSMMKVSWRTESTALSKPWQSTKPQQTRLRTAAAIAWTSRWSALLAAGTIRLFACSLLTLPSSTSTNVDGPCPPLCDVLTSYAEGTFSRAECYLEPPRWTRYKKAFQIVSVSQFSRAVLAASFNILTRKKNNQYWRKMRLNASKPAFLVGQKISYVAARFARLPRRGSRRCGMFPRRNSAAHKRGRQTPSRQPTPCLRRCRGIPLTQPSPTTWTTSMDFAKRRRFERNKNQTVNAPGNTDVLVLSSPHSITSTVCTIFLFLFFAPWELIIRHMGAPTHCQQFVGCRGNVAKQWSRFNKRCVRTQMHENHMCREGCIWYPFPRRKLKQDGGAELFARSVQRMLSDPWDKVCELLASLVPHALLDVHNHDNHIQQEYSCSVNIHDKNDLFVQVTEKERQQKTW